MGSMHILVKKHTALENAMTSIYLTQSTQIICNFAASYVKLGWMRRGADTALGVLIAIDMTDEAVLSIIQRGNLSPTWRFRLLWNIEHRRSVRCDERTWQPRHV